MSDKVTREGDYREKGSARKIGDVRVELAKDPNELVSRVVYFENKTDKSFKKIRTSGDNVADEKAILKSMVDMFTVRQCDAGVFVLDDEHLNMQNQSRWKVLDDDKLLIVVDRLNPNEDIVQLAYAWARWQASKATFDEKKLFDLKDFETQLDKLLQKVNSLSTINGAITTGVNGVLAAQEQLSTLRGVLAKEIEALLSTLDDDEPETP